MAFERGSALWFGISCVLLLTLLSMEIANLPERWMEFRYSYMIPLFIINLTAIISFWFTGRYVSWEYWESFLSLTGTEYLLVMMFDVFFWGYIIEASGLYVVRILLLDSLLFWGLFYTNTHSDRSVGLVIFTLIHSAFNVLMHVRVFITFTAILYYQAAAVAIAYATVTVVSILLYVSILLKMLRKIVDPAENVLRAKKELTEYAISEEYSPFYKESHGPRTATIPTMAPGTE